MIQPGLGIRGEHRLVIDLGGPGSNHLYKLTIYVPAGKWRQRDGRRSRPDAFSRASDIQARDAQFGDALVIVHEG